jgi:DNA-binding CsgD family transcriptional regulator/tetratricopeptide (TPR) repeat protein
LVALAEVYRARVTLKKRSAKDGIGDVLPATPHSPGGASSVASAREAFLRGDFEKCVLELQGRTFADPRIAAEAVLVLARGLLRLQRSADVAELLAPVLSTFTTVDDDCTARMLHGYAIALSDDADRGLKLLAGADAAASSKRADRTIKAEIAYYRAVAHWLKHEYGEASRFAAVAERAKVDVVSVRAMELRGFIALAKFRFDEALRFFHRAQHAYARCRGRDLGLATQIICQIAFLEMNLRSAKIPGTHVDAGGRTIPGTSFGPAIATSNRMALISADAWLYALDGDRRSAVQKARDANEIAPSPAWRVWALSSGATLYQAFGETGNAYADAMTAVELSASIDWNATADEERIGLLWLAEALASIEPALAPTILNRYDGVTSEMDPTRLLRDRSADPRLAGWDAYVRGLVARGAGDHDRAGDYLRQAVNLLNSCGYLWREALALIELDATPIDTRGEIPLERAAIIIRDNFPNSFLAARLGSHVQAYIDPIGRLLTPAQRDVLRRVIEGKNTAKIAAETNRGRATVKTHLHHLHGAFGTRSIAELLAECQRRGLGLAALTYRNDREALPRRRNARS